MSMSTYVIGFVSPENEDYKKHAAVLKACVNAGVELLPKETAEFFGYKEAELYVLEQKLRIEIPVKEYEDDTRSGYELLVKDIPKECHKIRFVNSY